jgi:hypothetical protein
LAASTVSAQPDVPASRRRSATGRPRDTAADDDQRVALLEELYAALPSLECRGQCAESCVPVDMSDAERDRITRIHGVRIVPREKTAGSSCPALTFLGTCAVYEVRPMICRLWGVAEAMRCPHGCRPTGGWLPDQTAMDLLLDSLAAGGSPLTTVIPQLRAMVAQPELRPAVGRLLRGDRTAQAEIIAWVSSSRGGRPAP